MSSTPRTTRNGTGPGRGKPRARTSSSRVQAGASAAPSTGPAAAARRNLLTPRGLAVAAVVVLLIISYASSLRIYVTTEREIAMHKQSIAESQRRVDDLNAELQRWNDPDYVRAQARARLGWVMPGETGYRVVGVDGHPIGPALASGPDALAVEVPPVWWERLSGSVQESDQLGAPAPAPPPPLTDGDRTATPTPTPKATPTAKPLR